MLITVHCFDFLMTKSSKQVSSVNVFVSVSSLFMSLYAHVA